jgi:hypothetical protein
LYSVSKNYDRGTLAVIAILAKPLSSGDLELDQDHVERRKTDLALKLASRGRIRTIQNALTNQFINAGIKLDPKSAPP